MNVSEKIQKGKQSFAYFHNYAIWMFPQNYKSTLDAAEATLAKIEPRFFEFLGNAVDGMEESAIRARMEALCTVNKGQFPKKLSDFLRPFADPSKITTGWTDTIRIYSGAVFDGVTETAQAVGQGAANTLKTTGFLLPFALAGGILIFAVLKGKAA